MRTARKARSVAKCGLCINGMTMKGTTVVATCGRKVRRHSIQTTKKKQKQKGEKRKKEERKINGGKRPRQARRLQMSCACSATKLSSVWMSFEAAQHITYTPRARIMLTPSPTSYPPLPDPSRTLRIRRVAARILPRVT